VNEKAFILEAPVLPGADGPRQIERAKIVYVSFATIKKPAVSDVFIKAWGKSLKALAAEIAAHVAPPRGASKDTLATPQSTSSPLCLAIYLTTHNMTRLKLTPSPLALSPK
jgi:elongator complex protein 5